MSRGNSWSRNTKPRCLPATCRRHRCRPFAPSPPPSLFASHLRISGQEYSYPSDIWSLGVCLCTLAMGKYPFPTNSGYWGVVQAIQDSPTPTLGEQFDPLLQEFLDLCLAKDPSNRPPTSVLLEVSGALSESP